MGTPWRRLASAIPHRRGAPTDPIVFIHAQNVLPAGMVRLLPPFERDHPDDQEREDQQEGEVEAREHRRVPDGEGREGRAAGDDEPDLVAVPHRSDRLEHRLPVGVLPAQHGEQHADPEVEALGHEVRGPEKGEEAEPDDLERHLSRPAPAAARRSSASARPRSGGSSPGVPAHQIEVEDGEPRVQAHEHAQAEADGPRADGARDRVLGLQEPIGDPGLAPGLGENPAGVVGEEGERDPDERGEPGTAWRRRASCATGASRPRTRAGTTAFPGRPSCACSSS